MYDMYMYMCHTCTCVIFILLNAPVDVECNSAGQLSVAGSGLAINWMWLERAKYIIIALPVSGNACKCLIVVL